MMRKWIWRPSIVALLCSFIVLALIFLTLLCLSLPKQDFDLCSAGHHSCHPAAGCLQLISGYACKCNSGYFGDGFTCTDLDECKLQIGECSQFAQCINLPGAYTCRCLPGFVETGLQSCADVDECLSNPCHVNADCHNNNGSFTCQCKKKYTGDGITECKRLPITCVIKDDSKFPRCQGKIKWLHTFWKTHPCYAEHGVDGSVCSFVRYLSEIEQECPLLDDMEVVNRSSHGVRVMQLASSKFDLDNLTQKIIGNPETSRFLTDRITSMWPYWTEAFRTLQRKENMGNRLMKNVLVFAGVLADKGWGWAHLAKSGGPLGEMVQWADLIAALYTLGHNLHVSFDVLQMLNRNGFGSNPCGDEALSTLDFDLVYIDIRGLQLLQKEKFDLESIKCKLRVLDSFGTEARFNFLAAYDESEVSLDGDLNLAVELNSSKHGYGDWRLRLPQFLTMFPHSPDNSFLGFVVSKTTEEIVDMEKKREAALVYGKEDYMWKDSQPYLSVIAKYFDIEATASPDAQQQDERQPPEEQTQKPTLHNVPGFVKNHGLLKWDAVQKLLAETKVFVGLGFPLEGPAPLEAISKGNVFLNVKIDPPLSRLKDREFNRKKLFMEGKPTLRELTSQHPYMEVFVGPPHVRTVDLANLTAVEEVLKDIQQDFNEKKIRPYVPYEFTHEGLLQRLNAFVENQKFCETTDAWPSKRALLPVVSQASESCARACSKQGFICDNHMFWYLNSVEAFNASKVRCDSITSKKSLLAPYKLDNGRHVCVLQNEPLLYSCVDGAKERRRLCPCRKFVKGQVALAPDL